MKIEVRDGLAFVSTTVTFRQQVITLHNVLLDTGSTGTIFAIDRFDASIDRDPDVFVDVSSVYETKLAACLAHRSQFPKGIDSLQWLQSWDEERGQAIGAARAESFKRMRVW